MAEEEAGFTFVDKRKVVSGEQESSAASDTPVGADPQYDTQPQANSTSSAYDDADDSIDVEAPTVYMMVQYCVQLLAADAWQRMGLIADPRTGNVTVDLAQAKVAIDAVGDLVGRLDSAPESAVASSDQRELKTVLNNLRLNYVNQKSAVRDEAGA